MLFTLKNRHLLHNEQTRLHSSHNKRLFQKKEASLVTLIQNKYEIVNTKKNNLILLTTTLIS